MHFKLKYVMDGIRVDLGQDEVLDFSHGGTHHVRVRVRNAVDENDPSQKTLVCEGFSERKVDDSVEGAFQRFSSGVPLDKTQRAFFNGLLSELYDYMQRTVVTLRWRRSIMDGPTIAFRNGKEGYSFDGTDWQEASRSAASFAIVFGESRPKDKISETLCKEIVALVKQGASESLERQLFREAWNLRVGGYPKAALVIGVASAEIGFRRQVGKIGLDKRGRGKPITELVKRYWPRPHPIPTIKGIQIKPSTVLRDSLEKGILARNDVVHNGAAAPKRDELQDILRNIGQLLWIWDFYSGHEWALEYIVANSISK
jgi:hypothetical protein